MMIKKKKMMMMIESNWTSYFLSALKRPQESESSNCFLLNNRLASFLTMQTVFDTLLEDCGKPSDISVVHSELCYVFGFMSRCPFARKGMCMY